MTTVENVSCPSLPVDHPTFDNVQSAVYYISTLLSPEFRNDLAVCIYNTIFVYDKNHFGEDICNKVVMSYRGVAMTLANSSEPQDYMPIYTDLVSTSIKDIKDKDNKFNHYRTMVQSLVPAVVSFHEEI